MQRECAGDTLVLGETRRLLKNHADAGDFMEQPAVLESPPLTGFAPEQIISNRFRIVRLLGEGGMGEVYEAEDLVLGERIAIKTLRPEIAGDRAAAVRFRQELQLSRRVSHPNVCRVFELWEDESEPGRKTTFLTMELLEGETMAQRIASQGPFSPAEALPLIRQIAVGIGEIHQLGIVHRDLKPSNLHLVRQADGQTRVVVTDFGLARSTRLDRSLTQTGYVFGTPAYMAPEQFQSGQATFASDVYSFGVTIFEMITGRSHPLLAPSTVLPGLKPAWDEALSRTWDPDPNLRPAHPLDVVALLEKSQIGPRTKRVAALAAGLLLVLGALYATRQRPPLQFRLTKVTSDDGVSWQPSLSADGELVAYASDASHRGDLDIWVRRVNGTGARRITDDPAHDSEPGISPDGRRVAYRSERTPAGIYMRDVEGGQDRLVARFGHNPVFSPDGKEIAFWEGNDAQYAGHRARVFVASVDSGTTRQLVPEFADARHPAWSPDGKELIFQGCGPGCRDPESDTDWWRIAQDGSNPRATGALRRVLGQGLTLYLGPLSWYGGDLIFGARMTSDTNLWQVSLNAPWWPRSGKAVPLTSSTEEGTDPSVSRNGNVAFAGLSARLNLFLAPLDANGVVDPQRLVGDREIDSSPSMSSDGGRILYFRVVGNERRMVLRERGGKEILNTKITAGSRGIISAGGDVVAYSAPSAAGGSIYLRRDPVWTPELVCRSRGELLEVTDGVRSLLVANQSGIASLDLKSCAATLLVGNTGLTYDQASLSPDGHWMAVLGVRDSDHAQILLKHLEGGESATLIPITSTEDWIDRPRWTRDGRELVFVSNRDHFLCIWRQKLDVSMRPVGGPQPIVHMHGIRLSPSHLSRLAFNLSVSSGSVLFNAGDILANVWMARPER